MNFLSDISAFNQGGLKTPPAHEPAWKPEPGPPVKYNITKRAPGTFPVDQPKEEVKEAEEELPEITQHPLVTWLQNIGVELDINAYVDNLIDGVGMNTFDDIILAEPTMDDLISWGFADESDRNKVYYAIYPEQQPATISADREMALFEDVLAKIDEGTATDEELEFFLLMKAKIAAQQAVAAELQAEYNQL